MILTIEKELGGLDLLNIKNFYIVIVYGTGPSIPVKQNIVQKQ